MSESSHRSCGLAQEECAAGEALARVGLVNQPGQLGEACLSAEFGEQVDRPAVGEDHLVVEGFADGSPSQPIRRKDIAAA